MRLVKVSAWQLTDQELEELAANHEAAEPERAAELRSLKKRRREHPPARPREAGDKVYLVLR